MPTKTDIPSDQEIVEVLAKKGLGCVEEFDSFDTPVYRLPNGHARLRRYWNPLADPEGMGPIREVEARLTEEQWKTYLRILYQAMAEALPVIEGHTANRFIRHAGPRTCCLALYRVLKGE